MTSSRQTRERLGWGVALWLLVALGGLVAATSVVDGQGRKPWQHYQNLPAQAAADAREREG